MSANSLRQWLKVARKQVKQLRQTLDDELQNVLERNILRPQKSLVRVPVPVRRGVSLGNGTRYLHTTSRNSAQAGQRAQKSCNNSAPRFATSSGRGVFSQFNGAYRAPRGVPRGLYTNWNMYTMRFASGRAYSTAAIRITHDAAQNMAISLRCFFNLWDSFVPSHNHGESARLALRETGNGRKRLCAEEISVMRAMEVCRMIQDHRQELMLDGGNETGSEALGCVVDFQLPRLDVSQMPSMVFACDEALDKWRDELVECHAMMRKIEESVRTIYKNYGALPLEFGESFVRVRFPNLTMAEAELLMRDLGLTLGLVLPEPTFASDLDQKAWHANPNEMHKKGFPMSDFDPVLSPSSSSPSESQLSGDFSILSSQA
ncbi:LAME_0B05666g1_1 [Lachancea meyersii CBS 8951]|uniref:LAME_0B05666g1_1 n=1 Tax=Lachancea meyersii CBS 8951 TaxID=1266667 RepID=A0A1G4IVL5_9SACH|nr:LAME_0B05666g1_1 [Lachancea meyersii CBS 8951]